MYFEDLGIYGWDVIEPVILSAILADKSILFVGDHGANKTEACSVIANAIIGKSCTFRNFEVPHLNFDDLLGYTNPKKLAQGKIEFVETPISIWGADAVLFDEINKTNPFVQGKLHEIIRTKEIMGLETDLQMVFSAVNPPIKYQTNFMDLPLASRFSIIQVPNFKSFSEATRKKIMKKGKIKPDYSLKKIFKEARKYIISVPTKDIDNMVLKLTKDLVYANISFSGRQVSDLHKMFKACKALSMCSDMVWDYDILINITLSCIPEIQGIIRSDVEYQRIVGIVTTTLSGFKFVNPLLMSSDILDLLTVDTEDQDILDWINTIKLAISEEDNATILKSVIKKISSKKKLNSVTKDNLMKAAATVYIMNSISDNNVVDILFK